MNGVTGRMGSNQHLMRSIVAIRNQGGVPVSPTETIMPDPILVGRNAVKLKRLVELSGVEKWSTALDDVMSDPAYPVYFDAQSTLRRADAVRAAATAGKHVYCEKPTAVDTASALALHQFCEDLGVKSGVVQDKLWLPGLVKLRRVIDSGFLGRIFAATGEFGYWVFDGAGVPAQRPSWNYRKEDGGGIIIDMLCHWRYVLDNLLGPVRAVNCRGATHIKERVDEYGAVYACTADDAAYSMFEIEGPEGEIVVNFNSSWATRVRRDDLFTLQVDGEKGSALATLRHCHVQHANNTPRPTWNPDIEQPINFFEDWAKVPEQEVYGNAFKAQWELFLRHVVLDEPFRWTLREGAKGVQLAELGQQSWKERRWLEVNDLT